MLKNASCTPFSESLLLITFMSGLKLLSRHLELPLKKSPCIKRFYQTILHCVCLILLEFSLNGTSYMTINWRKECGFLQRPKSL